MITLALFTMVFGLAIILVVYINISVDAKIKEQYLCNREKQIAYWQYKGIPYIVKNIYE